MRLGSLSQTGSGSGVGFKSDLLVPGGSSDCTDTEQSGSYTENVLRTVPTVRSTAYCVVPSS